jgi:hypothetical protein
MRRALPLDEVKPMNVDAVFGTHSGPLTRLVRRLALAWTLRGVPERGDPIPLGSVACDRLEGTRLLRPRDPGVPQAAMPGGVIVSTLRMGYGHHRIARAAVTWALEQGWTPYLHDLLELDSPEAECIERLDRNYSRCSRWAAETGGAVDRLWGAVMTGGGIESLRFFCALAEQLTPLMADLPRDLPVICAHPLNAQIAMACGFERVINLVIDNHPQHFVLAPGALNLVQGPAYEQALRRLGMPAETLQTAGHWVPADVLKGLPNDTLARLERVRGGAPVRLLFPIGGAGAQRRFVGALIRELAPLVRGGQAQLMLNAGDHTALYAGFGELLTELELTNVHVRSWSGLQDFCRSASAGDEPPPVALFGFHRHDHGFAATDLLMRQADVLVTKPSELAFAPLPKLHIRRVGGHEAASALRSAELGDGTLEQRTVSAAASIARELVTQPERRRVMNQRILALAAGGVYAGARRAVELAACNRPPRELGTPARPS